MVGMNFTFADRETGTRWQQETGEAFEGPLKGSRLEIYPFLITTWKEWSITLARPLSERSKLWSASCDGAPLFAHDLDR